MASAAPWISIPQFEKSESFTPYYYIKSRMHGYVLEVKGANGNQKTPVVVSPQLSEPANHQLWSFKDCGDGYCYIISKLNGLVMDIKGCRHSKGGSLIMFPKNTPPRTIANQRWKIDSDGYIMSQLNGMVLDIKGAKRNKEASVITWVKKPHNADNQRWRLEEAEVHSPTDAASPKFSSLSQSGPGEDSITSVTYIKEHRSFERMKLVHRNST